MLIYTLAKGNKMELLTWSSVLTGFAQALQALAADASVKRQAVEIVLTTLSEAYHATRAYYDIPESERNGRREQWDIADKWYRASILLEKYDKNLSHRLHLKSRFWRDGATWSDKQIIDAKIRLEAVWVEVNGLMRTQG